MGVCSHFCNLNFMKMFGQHWLSMCIYVSLVSSSFTTLSSLQQRQARLASGVSSGAHDVALLLVVDCCHQKIQVNAFSAVAWSLNMFAIIVWWSRWLCVSCVRLEMFWTAITLWRLLRAHGQVSRFPFLPTVQVEERSGYFEHLDAFSGLLSAILLSLWAVKYVSLKTGHSRKNLLTFSQILSWHENSQTVKQSKIFLYFGILWKSHHLPWWQLCTLALS